MSDKGPVVAYCTDCCKLGDTPGEYAWNILCCPFRTAINIICLPCKLCVCVFEPCLGED